MKKKRELHIPPKEIKEAERLQEITKNDRSYQDREYYRELRREKVRNQKMPSHPEPQPKNSWYQEYMGRPATARISRHEAKKRRVEKRKEELHKAEIKRRKFLASLDNRFSQDASADDASPFFDALSNMEIGDTPP